MWVTPNRFVTNIIRSKIILQLPTSRAVRSLKTVVCQFIVAVVIW